MARKLTYVDALKILGTGDSKALAILDAVLGGAILASTAATASIAPLALLDARSELIRYGRAVLADIGQRKRGVKGRDRTELLFSAHIVLVITSYFEIVEPLIGPLDLDLDEQLRLAAFSSKQDPGYDLDRYLRPLRQVVPVPNSAKPLTELLAELESYYRQLSRSLIEFLQGSAYWDNLNETQRDRVVATLSNTATLRSVQRYEEGLRCLCVDCPEVFIWTLLRENSANRKELESLLRELFADTVSHLDNSLSGMSAVLRDLTSIVPSARLPEELLQHSQAQLSRPIADTEPDSDTAHFTMPTLERAYVNPRCRISDLSRAPRPADDSWWDSQPGCDDLQWFLAGYLTASPGDAPLVVLGRPGSGKSVLTKILAAKLPSLGFPTVRVPLRQVYAAGRVQDQVEHALRMATGRAIQWPDFVESVGEAMPVVLFDGFDELLQSTQVSQSDYLEEIQAFQQREAALGRPIAAIVTSRTVVADRVRYPQGAVIVRLDPFSHEQISGWLDVWNDDNRDHFAKPGQSPLSADDLRPYGEISHEPLLLLMLAIYDAEGPKLKSESEFDQAEVYERLLQRFVRREVIKLYPGLGDEQLGREVDAELLRLSVVALGMFNRGRQNVTAEEVDSDLSTLMGESAEEITITNRFRERVTPGRLVLGRFFFVHESRAMLESHESYSYEFLHSTFGEFLIARLAFRLLREISHSIRPTIGRSARSPDDQFLHAALSWAALTDREQVVLFLLQLIQRSDEDLGRNLIPLLRAADDMRLPDQYTGYSPAKLGQPSRHAVYAANILILTLASSGPIAVSELWATEDHPIKRWHSQSYLWKACLPYASWSALLRSMTVTCATTSDLRQDAIIHLSRADRTDWPPLVGAQAFAQITGGREFFRFGGKAEDLRLEQSFVNGWNWDFLTHATSPLMSAFPESLGVVLACEDGQLRSALHILVSLRLYAGTLDVRLYSWAIRCIAKLPTEEAERYFDAIFSQFSEDLKLLDQEVADVIVEALLQLMPSRREQIETLLDP